MVSTCPNCKRQIDHEDFLFEVQCECGFRFNPFYNAGQSTNGTDAGDPGTGGGNTDSAVNEEGMSAGDGYSESREAFREIVQFGELGEGTAEATTSNTSHEINQGTGSQQILQPPTPQPRSKSGDLSVSIEPSGAMMLWSDNIPGYTITEYFPPISQWVQLMEDAQDPLAAGFNALWERCLGQGANAVISMHWTLSSDGSRCLMSGLPVKCLPSTTQ